MDLGGTKGYVGKRVSVWRGEKMRPVWKKWRSHVILRELKSCGFLGWHKRPSTLRQPSRREAGGPREWFPVPGAWLGPRVKVWGSFVPVKAGERWQGRKGEEGGAGKLGFCTPQLQGVPSTPESVRAALLEPWSHERQEPVGRGI